MKNETILKKAIEKVSENGYPWMNSWKVKRIKKGPKPHPEPYIVIDGEEVSYYELIFSHDFAKSYWKNWKWYQQGQQETRDGLKPWQYHLQQMILKKDPLKYIEGFL